MRSKALHAVQSTSKARAMVACSKCLGAGVTPAKPSRRQLHEHRAAAAAAQGPIARPVLRRVPCTACGGVGLQPGPPAPPLHAGSPAPAVAIVGGGIGGAALALALQQRGVPVRVFERDACFAERAQGYGLTMQQGATALKQLGLPNEGVFSVAPYTARVRVRASSRLRTTSTRPTPSPAPNPTP